MTRSRAEERGGANGYGRLGRQVILDASLRLTAREGVTQVRFRDLGTELGADPTAVYRHFRNKHALMTALIERLLQDVTDELGRPEDDNPETFLIKGAEVLFETFLRHPAIGIHLADARPVGTAELELVERLLRSLQLAGLRDQALIDHYATYSGFVLAHIASACRALVISRSTGTDNSSWMPGDAQTTAERHPILTRYGRELGQLNLHSAYHSAVRVIVDSAMSAGTDG